MSYYISNKEIDVIVVTYNRLPLLKECLNALIVQKENIDKIFVIDNNSTDGTSAFLKGLRGNSIFYVKRLTKNIGGAAGFEMGVQIAMNKGNGNYIWIMDDDTIPSKDASKYLLSAADYLNNQFGFLCSNVRLQNGEVANVPIPAPTWPIYSKNGLVKVVNATFVSLLVKRKIVQKVGLPIGEMKIWGDDTEYTTRVSRIRSSYHVANSIVIHKTDYVSSKDTIKNASMDRIRRYKYSYRNRIYISRKYASTRGLFKQILLEVIDAFTCFKAKSYKVKRFNAVVIGLFSGFFFNPKIKYSSEREEH